MPIYLMKRLRIETEHILLDAPDSDTAFQGFLEAPDDYYPFDIVSEKADGDILSCTQVSEELLAHLKKRHGEPLLIHHIEREEEDKA